MLNTLNQSIDSLINGRLISINSTISKKEVSCQAPITNILNKMSYDLEVGPDFGINSKELVNFGVIRPCFEFRKNACAYIRGLPESCKDVLAYLLMFKKATRVVINRKTFAEKLGYSLKTITRATNKLMADGLLYKYRENTYVSNDYILSPVLYKGKASFEIWLNYSLTEEQQRHYLLHGVLPNDAVPKPFLYRVQQGNVPCNINIYKREYLYYKRVRRGRAQVHNYPKKGMMSMKNGKRGLANVKSTDKQGLNLDEIGFSDTSKSISSLLSLNNSQKLKLFAFPESCLHHVWGSLKSMTFVYPKRGWQEFLKQAISFCTKLGIRPDWDKYKRLCTLYDIQVEKEHGSYTSPKKAPMYTRYIPEKESQVGVQGLLEQRQKWIQAIETYTSRDNFFIDLVKFARLRLRMVEEELALKIDRGEGYA